MESTSQRFGLVAESIDGAGVRVRRYRDEDVPAVQASCDDPLTQRFLPMLPSPYTMEDALWWVREGALPAFERGGGNFAIADPDDDTLLGGIGITHEQNGNGEIGYWVAPWGRSRGVATAATRALTDYAFAAGYGRLQLRTELENTASQRVAIAAGYVREGIQRGSGLARTGGRHDLVVWARLAVDPPGPSPRRLPDLPGGRLTDGVISLRPLRPGDADTLQALFNVDDVATTSSRGTPLDRATAARICDHADARWLAGSRAALVIEDVGTNAIAGEIVLTRPSEQDEGIVGYALFPPWRRRGYATRAVRLVSAWAFGPAGLARLVASTDPANSASQAVLSGAGFIREGYQRGHLPAPGGGRADVVSYALLATDLTDDR